MASSGMRLDAFVCGLSDDCINHFMIKERVNYLLLLFFNYNYITCAIYQDYDSDSNGQREKRRNF